MPDDSAVLFICEKYYLRFYRSLADHLFRAGFRPIWVALDGLARWDYEHIDPSGVVERLARAGELTNREDVEPLCAFERAVFERPDLFRHNYPYTLNVVRTLERARRLAQVWYQLTLGLLSRFGPRAIFLWNGRYLPYSAVSAACSTAGQLFLTSEIGWVPGTIFVDRGALSADTTDLFGRTFESAAAADLARADSFLKDYRTEKATMVSQTIVPSSEARQRLLGTDGAFLLVYGCQVDWDTNIVIGSRRFRSNEAAVSFLMECVDVIHGARIVVKTHPLDSRKKDQVLRDLVGDRGAVVSHIHPHTLIEAADCVAVRNSTLGFETLCYGKPLILLEEAKYKHPGLTLDASDTAEAASNLASVARKQCRLPDPGTFRQFVLHLLDHYLVPVRYNYHFDPTKLELLSHLARNDSYRGLEQVLHQGPPPNLVGADDRALRAIDACEVRRRQQSSLRKRVRRLADWLF